MIFDRTQNDVNAAIHIREEKVQKFQELSEEEIQTLEKGTLTINSLNRIEEKQEELKNLFEENFYFVEDIKNKSWGYSDFFLQEDFDRILSNLEKLVKAYFVYANTPKIPDSNYRKYQTINDVEKILYDLEVMIIDVKSNYRECGTFECGEE